MTHEQENWSVGELAKAAGLTVRTLHHYDELGLLQPSERTHAGHRRYGPDDVERLYRIVALRRLGLRLEEVGGLLDGGGAELAGVVRRQLAHVDEQLADYGRLRWLLRRVLHGLDAGRAPDVAAILATIEVTSMVENYYTPEQRERLAARAEALGPEGMEGVQREWEGLFAGLRRELRTGTDPADPRLRSYAERSRELLALFTGGEADIAASLGEVWRNEDPAQVSHGMVDRELWDYYARVQAAAGGERA